MKNQNKKPVLDLPERVNLDNQNTSNNYQRIFTIIYILCFSLFLMLAFYIYRVDSAIGPDKFIMNWAYSIRSDLLTKIMEFITFWGEAKVVIVLMFLICGALFYFDKKQYIMPVLFSNLGAFVVRTIFKQLIERPRPLGHSLIKETGFSFPSGHTIAVVAFYGLLFYFLFKYLKKTWQKVITFVLGTIFILLVGFSRIYLGVHYPSDVLGSYLFAIGWLIFFVLYLKKNDFSFA